MIVEVKSSPVTLFVCVDLNALTQPDWITGMDSQWKDTGLEIKTDLTSFKVYTCNFEDTTKIRLRGCLPHHDPSERANYFVLTVPAFNDMSYSVAELDDYIKIWPRNRIVQALNKAGFETKQVYSVRDERKPDEKEIYCLIRARPNLIMEHAERMGLLMPLQSMKLKEMAYAGYNFGDTGQYIRPVILTNKVLEPRFGKECRDPYGDHYAGYRREARLNDLWVRNGPNGSPFSTMMRLKVIDNVVKAKHIDGGAFIPVNTLILKGAALAYYPLHEPKELQGLSDQWIVWVHKKDGSIKWKFWDIPVTPIKDYFGEKVAIYFAYLTHYTKWLLYPAAAGAIAQIWILAELDVNGQAVLPFTIIVAMWTVIYLENWKRRQCMLQMKWGTAKFEDVEEDRPEFEGDDTKDPTTGLQTTWYDPMKRQVTSYYNLSLIGVMITCVIGVIAAIFLFRYWSFGWGSRDADGNLNAERLVIAGEPMGDILASLMTALQIQILGGAYKKLADWMTNKENHQTQTQYEDSLIAKVFLFQFCNSYSSLFYIAFIKPTLEQCGGGNPGECLDELFLQLFIIFGTRLVSGNAMEIGLPWAERKYKEYKHNKNPDAKELSTVETQYDLDEYGDEGIFEDYAEMSVQFGYATLFAPACPIAPVMALANNYVELRVDAMKLCNNTRRPIPKGAGDIGTWYSILSIMATLAVATNGLLLAFTSKLFNGPDATYRGLSNSYRVWIFLVFEHAVLILRYTLETLIPDTPEVCEIQAKRTARLTEKVILLTPDDPEADPDPGQDMQLEEGGSATDDARCVPPFLPSFLPSFPSYFLPLSKSVIPSFQVHSHGGGRARTPPPTENEAGSGHSQYCHFLLNSFLLH
jgi:anoctamin-10/anoctamin-7